MKKLLVVLPALGLVIGCTKPAESGALNGVQHRSVSVRTEGKGSFNEEAAITFIYNAGYRHIEGMRHDANGVWHGKATKAGQTTAISVNDQGAVTPG